MNLLKVTNLSVSFHTAGKIVDAVKNVSFGIEKGEIAHFLSRYGFELHDHRDARQLEEMYFKDPGGRIVGRVNGTHCLVRALRTET